MAEITKIRTHSSGTAYINLSKTVLAKSKLKKEDNMVVLFPKTDETLIIKKVEDDLL